MTLLLVAMPTPGAEAPTEVTTACARCPEGAGPGRWAGDPVEGYRPRRILSSPYVRCCETVRPLSKALGLPVESVDALAESHGSETLRLMERIGRRVGGALHHGDVALEVLTPLPGKRPAKARQSLRLQKGEVWVIQSVGTSLSIVEHLRQVAGGSR